MGHRSKGGQFSTGHGQEAFFAPDRVVTRLFGWVGLAGVDHRSQAGKCTLDVFQTELLFGKDPADRLQKIFYLGTADGRIGLRRLSEIADRMVRGTSRPADAELLVDLSHDVVASALCDHERLATLPLMSGMRYFQSELEDHILRSTCPAGVCHPISVAAGPAH